MDFLKSCSTNVHAIDNLDNVRFQRLDHAVHHLSELERWTRLHDAIARLRKQNILCACADGHLYVFGSTDHVDASGLGVFDVAEEDRLDNSRPKHTASGILLSHVLLDAMESGISYALAQDESIVHIAPWTWIYSVVDEESEQRLSYIMKLHHRFASNGGLFLVPEINPTSCLVSRGFAEVGQDVLVVPSCAMAKIVTSDAESVVSDPQWKTCVSKAMACEGVYIPESAEWIVIRLSRDFNGPPFSWPSELLLAHHMSLNTDLVLAENMDPRHNWHSWFHVSGGGTEFRNPFSLAEEWFFESASRAQAAAAAAAVSDGMIPTESSVIGITQTVSALTEPADITSPPFTQRSVDQQAAVIGIYPTPPDGINSSQQNLHSIPANTPSITQGDQGPASTEQLLTSDDIPGKGQDYESNLDVGGFAVEQDELFGDSGEMEFVENDIGDADFSFFDEPDEEPPTEKTEDCDMLDTTQIDESQPQPSNTVVEDATDATSKVEQPTEELEDISSRPDEIVFHPANENHVASDQNSVGGNAAVYNPEFGGQVTAVEKPLDPFGIRERLLPPPVPASIAQNDHKDMATPRRNSTFAPIVFRENLRLGSTYTADVAGDSLHLTTQNLGPNISLPRKKSRLLKKRDQQSNGSASDDSESEEDSYESSSSDTDENLPPKLPWDSRKRKRHSDIIHKPTDHPLRSPWFENDASHRALQQSDERTLLLIRRQFERLTVEASSIQKQEILSLQSTVPPNADVAVSMDELYDLHKEELLYVAQIVQEQAATNLESSLALLAVGKIPRAQSGAGTSTCSKAIGHAIDRIFPQNEHCDLGKVSLTRDPHAIQRAGSNTNKGPHGQPRPLQRPDHLVIGPDYFPLQPPYVKIQRGLDCWEMLSTCLSFWETLGLGPANGSKSIRAFCVFPGNDDLQGLVGHFIAELGTAYESCKLGSHSYLRNVNGSEELDTYEDGMAPVELDTDVSLEAALRAYAATCIDLGKALSFISRDEGDRTIVIYVVNPFPGTQAKQYLCACFWMLFKTYRDNLPKSRRTHCGNDIVLQILPIHVIADFDMLVVQDSKLMSSLAREVYDRCPPSTTAQANDNTSVLPILAAPSVELAAAAPKRIGFQLAPDPPSDLLHEGSILHIAYACSTDRQWLTAAWSDNTGQYFSTAAFSLRGRSFLDGAEQLWDRTREILAARRVTWRIFIVTSDALERSISQLWRSLSSKPRQQALCVTMLSVQTDPEMRLLAPDQHAIAHNDQGFLTPATTPQASTFTSSPDVSSHANAPLTPAPSETAASLTDNDPDAHLIDLTDESFGVMLSPKLTNLASITGLANGALVKRRDPEPQSGQEIPSLGVNLHWTIQIKPSGGVDEGSIKQAELTLREVLRMYRNLSVLTKTKGLDHGRARLSPLHIAVAMRGATWLNGMLPVD